MRIEMKPIKDIQVVRNSGSLSISIPSCGSAYIPKVNMKRPGNIVFTVFLLFLIALLIGLAVSDDHNHNYSDVKLVINVASISGQDLQALAANQAFYPVKVNGPKVREMVFREGPSIGRSQYDNWQSLRSESTTAGADREQLMAVDVETQREGDKAPTYRERPEQVMTAYRRSPLPLAQAKVLLESIPMSWPVNDSVSNVLSAWSEKFTVMTDEQNLAIIGHLMNHYKLSGNKLKRNIQSGMLVTFEEDRRQARSKRQSVSPCDSVKEEMLAENIKQKFSKVSAYKFLSEREVCIFFAKCIEGAYPDPSGCRSDHDIREPNQRIFISDKSVSGHQELIPGEDLADICSIETHRIRDCHYTQDRKVEVLFYKVQGRTGYVIGHHAITEAPLYDSLSDFNCTQKPSPSCDGDDTFKALFTTAGHGDSDCYCSADTKRSTYSLTVSGINYPIDGAFYGYVKMKYNRHKEEDLKCINCDISCSQGEVRVDYSEPVEMVELCSGRFCMDVRPDRRFTVPLSLAAMDYSYSYYIRFADNKEMTGTIQCKIEELCPLIDCHLCVEKLKNPHCYNVVDKINFLVILISWFLVVAIFSKVLKIIINLLLMVKKIFKACFNVAFWILKKILSCMGTQMTRVTEITSVVVEQADGSTKVQEHKQKKVVFKKQPEYFKVFTIICLLLFPLALGCTDTKTVSSSNLRCSLEEGVLKCSTESAVSISVAPVGQSSCFILKSADGKVAGSIQMETISLNLVCNKHSLYWTFDASTKFNQECYCTSSASGWGNSNKCSDYNKNSNCGKPLNCPKWALSYSRCQAAVGGWENGCFSYASSYCYYNVDIINYSKTAYEVYTCSSFYWQAAIRLKIQTVDGEQVVNGKLNSGSTLSFKDGNVQLISASVPPMPILSSCFLKGPQGTLVSDCQKTGGIVKGKVGEIQCSTKALALAPKNSGCSFSKGVHEVGVSGGQLNYISSFYLPRTIKTRLPVRSAGYTIREDGESLIASLNQMSMMTLMMRLSSFKMIPYSQNSKCNIKVLKVSGCSSCLGGATIKLRAKSDDQSAKAVLSCPSLKADIPFLVKPTEEIIDLRANFELGILKETCKVQCPGNSIELPIEASLVSDISISRTFEEHFSDITETASSWLRGIMGQFEYVLLIPLIGVAVLGTILVLKYMLPSDGERYHYKSR